MLARRSLLPFVLVAALPACASYEPRPIEPDRAAAAFRARSLADPGLRAFVERNLGGRPADRPRAAWDLEALTLVAFYFHPDLDAARARARTAEAGVVTAGERPNPALGLSPAYIFNPELGGAPYALGFSLDVPVETAGKRGRRIARAERLSLAARLALAETAWRVRSRVRSALLDLRIAEDLLDARRAEARLRAEVTGIVERRLAVGDASSLEAERARSDELAASLAARAAEGRAVEDLMDLAAALGLPPGAVDGKPLSWPDLARPPSETALPLAGLERAAALNRLDLRRLLAEYGATEEALGLEVAKQTPDVHLAPGYAFEQGQSSLTLGLAVGLPVLSRNEGPIAEAAARREEARIRFLAAQSDAIGEIARVRARYRSALADSVERPLSPAPPFPAPSLEGPRANGLGEEGP